MVQLPVTCRLSIDITFVAFNPFWVYYLSITELLFNEHMALLKYSSYLNRQPFGILPVCGKNWTQEVWEGSTGVYVALIFVPVEEDVILWSHILEAHHTIPHQPIHGWIQWYLGWVQVWTSVRVRGRAPAGGSATVLGLIPFTGEVWLVWKRPVWPYPRCYRGTNLINKIQQKHCAHSPLSSHRAESDYF